MTTTERAQEEGLEFFEPSTVVPNVSTQSRQNVSAELFIFERTPRRTQRPTLQLRAHHFATEH